MIQSLEIVTCIGIGFVIWILLFPSISRDQFPSNQDCSSESPPVGADILYFSIIFDWICSTSWSKMNGEKFPLHRFSTSFWKWQGSPRHPTLKSFVQIPNLIVLVNLTSFSENKAHKALTKWGIVCPKLHSTCSMQSEQQPSRICSASAKKSEVIFLLQCEKRKANCQEIPEENRPNKRQFRKPAGKTSLHSEGNLWLFPCRVLPKLSLENPSKSFKKAYHSRC